MRVDVVRGHPGRLSDRLSDATPHAHADDAWPFARADNTWPFGRADSHADARPFARADEAPYAHADNAWPFAGAADSGADARSNFSQGCLVGDARRHRRD